MNCLEKRHWLLAALLNQSEQPDGFTAAVSLKSFIALFIIILKHLPLGLHFGMEMSNRNYFIQVGPG